jgi:hypothetical protein
LADDELARIALTDELVPEAQEKLEEGLQTRGLTDLWEYKRALDRAAADRAEATKPAQNEVRLHLVFVIVLYRSAWFLYRACGWPGIHKCDARAVFTSVLAIVVAADLAVLRLLMRK